MLRCNNQNIVESYYTPINVTINWRRVSVIYHRVKATFQNPAQTKHRNLQKKKRYDLVLKDSIL